MSGLGPENEYNWSAAIDLLVATVDRVPEMAKEALARGTHRPIHPDRTTLDSIGKYYGVTRERVRQVQNRAASSLIALIGSTLRENPPRSESESPYELVGIADFGDAISPDSAGAIIGSLLLSSQGFRPLASASDIWCRNKDALIIATRSIHLDGPLLKEEWDRQLDEVGAHRDLLVRTGYIQDTIVVGEYVVRADRERADRVTLILRELGGQASTEQILERLPEDIAPRALSAYLGRYPQFARDTLRRIWEFAGDDTTPRYTSTLPLILDILSSEGPITRRDLVLRVQAVHPVSDWRISQCLTDSKIGRMPDGRIWLVENGAIRQVESEPPQPESMVAVSDTVGVRLTIDHDLTRGSGINVQRWLAWRLGLTTVPSEMTFYSEDGTDFKLTIKSIHAGSTISTLRDIVNRQSLGEGCQVVLLLRTRRRTWNWQHVCPPGECPTRDG